MTQEVAVYQAATRYSEQDVQALKDTVAKGCTDAQFKVFMLAARRLGLDPFARQIVPITQSGGMTPQITIDGFRLIAQRTGQYGGQIGPFWCGADGVWHDVWLAKENPAAAKVAVIRRDFAEPMWGVARFASYNKVGNWGTMPDVMIAKVAESLALRKAFPQELAGIYGEEEMAGAGPLVNTTTGEVLEPAPIRALSPNEPRTATGGKADSTARPSWKGLHARAARIGSSQEDWERLIVSVTGHDHDFTPAEYRAVEKAVADAEREHYANVAAAGRVPEDALEGVETGAPA